jgi:putative transcriptional regulator
MINSVKVQRGNKGLTQVELAEKVKVSRQTIISIESGKYLPSIVLAMKISKVLKMKVEELFELEKSD